MLCPVLGIPSVLLYFVCSSLVCVLHLCGVCCVGGLSLRRQRLHHLSSPKVIHIAHKDGDVIVTERWHIPPFIAESHKPPTQRISPLYREMTHTTFDVRVCVSLSFCMCLCPSKSVCGNTCVACATASCCLTNASASASRRDSIIFKTQHKDQASTLLTTHKETLSFKPKVVCVCNTYMSILCECLTVSLCLHCVEGGVLSPRAEGVSELSLPCRPLG